MSMEGEKKMDIFIIVGFFVGFASLILAFVFDGGHIGALLAGTSALLVFGGTIGAVIVSYPFKIIKRIPKIFKIAFLQPKNNQATVVEYFKDISYTTRRNGLLSLESEINNGKVQDEFVKKGLQMVVDGVEPQVIKSTLELQVEAMEERHRMGASIFEAAGGFAPTMGIIGTVMGLVHVLGNLDDPSTLGPKIAVAFLATLYGVGSANLLWLPIGSKLKILNDLELSEKEMMIEGILLIQEGANPNVVTRKLEGFLTTDELSQMEGREKL